MRELAECIDTVFTPAALREAYRDLAERRDDLRVQQWILGTPRLQHEWLNSIGVTHEEELAKLIAPLPPVELRTITAAADVETFLWTGFVDAREFLGHFLAHHTPEAWRTWTSLDFGCGCGRLTRFFAAAAPAWQASACDINPDHVDWCRQNLPAVDTRLNRAQPPLPFEDASIDFAYSLSVFSHLPAEQAAAWIADLRRVVRPGGIVLVTTHGATALDTIASSPLHQQMFQLTPGDVVAVRDQLARDGCAYRRLSSDIVRLARSDDDYGNFFVDRAYVANTWLADGMELCAYIPGGLRGWQDIVVLRRTASG